MRAKPPIDDTFQSVGTFEVAAQEQIVVELSTEGAGNVHADAVQFLLSADPFTGFHHRLIDPLLTTMEP